MAIKKSIVPKDFEIPGILATDQFKLSPLTIDDVDQDYQAIMNSLDHLRGVFGERSTWPSPDLTRKQDLIDLGWHQKEFQMRSSFTYKVTSLDAKEYLGCVYILPSRNEGTDVDIFMWVTQEAFGKGLDLMLFEAVKKWIQKKWSFNKVRYPGREK
ncbi:GNAT family N-acetyltransferase [Candidatus Microgenomates bacterium]|nr:GNAT family N-acetyltransferase [Candidatus Microgenomates bacterium]